MAVIKIFLAVFMSKDQRKLSVLELLKKHPSPITLPTLLLELGAGYSDRTVRRWLSEWVELGLVKKTGQKRSTQYIAIMDGDLAPASAYFSPASQKVIERVKIPYALRKPITYNPSWLENYRPNIDAYL